MIYKKPSGISYCDMCIYIDNHIYEKDKDEDKIFQYLYHLYFMLAHRGKLFQSTQDYEDFSLYAASCMMMRYKNPKQETGEMKRIKSSLNWAKRALYGLSVNFRNKHFQECLNESVVGEEGILNLKEHFSSKISRMGGDLLQVEMEEYFKYIPRTIKSVIMESPYRSSKIDVHKIYLSTLLSLISTFTMSNQNKNRLKKYLKSNLNIINLVNNIYQEESISKPILFHLPEEMSNYISYLVNKCRHIIGKDIKYLSNNYKVSDDVVKDILTPVLEED